MNAIIETEKVSKFYSRQVALNEVDLKIPQGSIFGLLGPNGAGKTSLIRIITRITAPDSGRVCFSGEPLHSGHVSRMGYLPEERGLYRKMEVGEQLIYFAMLKGMSRHDAYTKTRSWMEKFDMANWWKRKIEELSKGMQQKVQFVATVVHEPELLILDEPFSGFDPINAGMITDEILQLRRNGTTIVFSTHRMESVEQLCDHIALIHKSKKILEGEVNEIRSRFRSGIYEAVFIGGEAPVLPAEIVRTDHLANGQSRCLLMLNPGVTSNQLLTELLAQAEVIRFEEQIPGMQEIFIRAVSEN